MAESVCVIGASGRLGLQLVKEGLARKKQVKAIVRNPAKMIELLQAEGVAEGSVTVVEANIFDSSQLVPHFTGASAVLSALGASALFSPSTTISRAIEHTCEAAKTADVRKILLCSSWGCGDHFEEHDAFLYRFFVHWIIYYPLQDHEGSEKFLHSFQQSSFPALRFCCIRPPELGEGPKTDLPLVAQNDKYSLPNASNFISRADVARFFYDLLNDDQSPHWNHSIAMGVQTS